MEGGAVGPALTANSSVLCGSGGDALGRTQKGLDRLRHHLLPLVSHTDATVGEELEGDARRVWRPHAVIGSFKLFRIARVLKRVQDGKE